MSWLNYHHLLYFKTIATEGSISKASAKLKVGQPALSAQLKQLEENFGHKLFERKNRKLFLTEAGRAALQYANRIADLGVELQEVLRDKMFATKPHLKVGVLDSVPKVLVVDIIQAARKIADCHITVLDGTSDELYLQLSTHSIDLVISNHHLQTSNEDSIFTRKIGKLPVYLYGAARFKNIRRNFPQSLNGQPIILPTKHSKLRHDVDHFFEVHNVICPIIAETQDTAVQKLLASEGSGLIVEPRFAVEAYLKEKKLIQIGMLKGVYEEFFLISAKRILENPVATKLMKSFSFTANT